MQCSRIVTLYACWTKNSKEEVTSVRGKLVLEYKYWSHKGSGPQNEPHRRDGQNQPHKTSTGGEYTQRRGFGEWQEFKFCGNIWIFLSSWEWVSGHGWNLAADVQREYQKKQLQSQMQNKDSAFKFDLSHRRFLQKLHDYLCVQNYRFFGHYWAWWKCSRKSVMSLLN